MPILILNGDGTGPINNLCVPTDVCPAYGPAGKSLISVSVLGCFQDRQRLQAEVQAQLIEWFGEEVLNWQHLRTYSIPYALPDQSPPALSLPERPVRLGSGIYVCGDHRDQASIQGAMVFWSSSRRGNLGGFAVYEQLATLVLAVHTAATLFMVGLIWFVQVVHYPLFSTMDKDSFVEYERRNTSLTTWVVAPAMLVEGGTASLLLAFHLSSYERNLVWLGFALLITIWLSTAFIQIPCHNSLSNQFSKEVHDKLVSFNWIRTIAWTMRGVLSLLLLV